MNFFPQFHHLKEDPYECTAEFIKLKYQIDLISHAINYMDGQHLIWTSQCAC